MNKNTIFLAVAAIINSCNTQTQNKRLTYQNIVILSDMSNRLQNKVYPQKDSVEIHKLVDYFKNDCVKPGEKIGDKSSMAFAVFSEKEVLWIDLSKIKDLGEKQRFINSTGEYKTIGLKSKLIGFEDTVRSIYNKVSNPGLDLISLLTEKIENEDLIKKNITLTDGIDTTFLNFENHIYIFTDGYLEYNLAGKQENKQYYFGQPEIDKLRKYCISHGITTTAALLIDKSLGLPGSESKRNRTVNLHIMETEERDKDTKFQTYSHIKGLRDNEILEAVWRKWAKDSGFKSLEWNKY